MGSYRMLRRLPRWAFVVLVAELAGAAASAASVTLLLLPHDRDATFRQSGFSSPRLHVDANGKTLVQRVHDALHLSGNCRLVYFADAPLLLKTPCNVTRLEPPSDFDNEDIAVVLSTLDENWLRGLLLIARAEFWVELIGLSDGTDPINAFLASGDFAQVNRVFHRASHSPSMPSIFHASMLHVLVFPAQIYATGEEQNDLPKMYANAHANPERPLEQYPWCHEPGQEAYRPLELWCAMARHTCTQRGLSQSARRRLRRCSVDAPFGFADVGEPTRPTGYPPSPPPRLRRQTQAGSPRRAATRRVPYIRYRDLARPIIRRAAVCCVWRFSCSR